MFVDFNIDIANAPCEETGAQGTLVQRDRDGIIPALLARRYDAIIASTSITEDGTGASSGPLGTFSAR